MPSAGRIAVMTARSTRHSWLRMQAAEASYCSAGSPILGSGSIVAQLAPERPIDEHRMMVDLVALGNGRTMFEADEDQGVQEWEGLPKLRDGLRDDIS